MSELRKDPLSHRWVVISKDRAARPDEFRAATVRRAVERCPFCAGNEADTPAAVSSYPASTNGVGKEWQVRVVPNRFPAIESHVPCPNIGSGSKNPNSLHTSLCGFGFHEVIIESPNHAVSFSDLSVEQATWTLTAYRDRMAQLRQDKRIKYVQIFKNVGAAGGASIEHAHSQLMALPIVPEDIGVELSVARDWLEKTRRCVYCRLLEDETDAATRMIASTEHFAAFCPYASRFPYESWVLPRRHVSHFESSPDEILGELSAFLQNIVRRIERATGGAAYNYLLHSAPFNSAHLPFYHWHFEVFPRTTTAAGFEWGTGFFINPVPPEEAAAILRDAK